MTIYLKTQRAQMAGSRVNTFFNVKHNVVTSQFAGAQTKRELTRVHTLALFSSKTLMYSSLCAL